MLGLTPERTGCPEEVAYLKKFITADDLRALVTRYNNSAYGRYLQRLADE
jgi:dTDP-glucose pyrophosphorylase